MSGMWEDMPELMDEHERQANLCFQAYMFYKKINNNTREGRCTACDAVITVSKVQRTTTAEETVFYDANHNEKGKCPICGTDVIYKSAGRSVEWKALRATATLVIFLPVNENKIYARAFYVFKDYKYYDKGYSECMRWSETVRYILQPGEWNAYKSNREYFYFDTDIIERNKHIVYQKSRTAIEPFAASAGNGYLNGYEIINSNCIKETFLKYSQLDLFCKDDFYYCRNKAMKYLSLYCKHPQFELLMKLGHRDIVEEYVYSNRNNSAFVNWKAHDITTFFGLPKNKYKEFRAKGGSIELLKSYKKLYKVSPNTTDFDTVIKYKNTIKYYYAEFEQAIVKYHLPHVQYFNYLQKNVTEKNSFHDVLIMHLDYLESAVKLEYDLTKEVVTMPKKLKQAHDTAYKTVLLKKDEIEAKEQAKLKGKENIKLSKLAKKLTGLYEKRKLKYVFSDNNFCIIQPECVQDIIDEGKALEHCVGGYADRHADGKLTILFLRNINTPETSYQTIEMKNEGMRQIQGYKNKSPLSNLANEFLRKWLIWVEAGSVRDKEGKPVIEEVERDRVLVAS